MENNTTQKNTPTYLLIALNVIVLISIVVMLYLFLRKPKLQPIPDVISLVNRIERKIDSNNHHIFRLTTEVGALKNRKDTTLKYYNTIEKKYTNEYTQIDNATNDVLFSKLQLILTSYAQRFDTTQNR